MTLRPEGHSILAEMPGGFTDDDWMAARTKGFDRPMNIYEVHAGSWKRKPDGSWYSYAELGRTAARLLPGEERLHPTWNSCRWPSIPLTAAGATR